MRILMTTDTIGGVWRFTQELVSGLLEQGCEICLVSLGGRPSHPQCSWLEEMEDHWQNRFRHTPTDIPLEWMQDNQSAYEGAAPLLLGLASSFNADIIHTNQFCFGALHTSIPKLITAHSDVFSWAACCRTRALEPSPWLDHYCALVSAGIAGADAIAAPTIWMLHALLNNFPLPPGRHVIPNGRSIPPAPSVPRKLQAVTAGRLWDEAKNIAVLAGVSSPIPISAAGCVSCESAAMPPLSGVQLLGPISEEKLLSLFRGSAIYICTSKYEPFGLAPLEAALCGCAVLANDIPSLREVWGAAALYFTDAASLTALLDELSCNPGLLEMRQVHALKHALTFTRKRMTEAYLTLFQELVAQTREKELAGVA